MRKRSESAGARAGGAPNLAELHVPPRARYVNIYHDDRHLVLIRRGENGERVITRAPADGACFLRRAEVPAELYRMAKVSPMVRALVTEGDWIRVVWRNAYDSVPACRSLEDKKIPTYEGDLTAARRYCIDRDVQIDKPRRAYFDLETDSRVSFAHKEDMRILCWCLVDGETGEPQTGCLEADTDADERVLLDELWAALDPYDQALAWNGDRFDFYLLRARSKRLGCKVEPKQWLWLDHMKLFDRQNMMAAESGEEKTSLALQAIATAVLGEGKDDFDASKTWEAWAAGGAERDRMVRYCIKDVLLMHRLEERTGYVELFQTLCEAVGVFPDSRGLAPSQQAESFLLRVAKTHNIHFPTKFRDEGGDLGTFKGAFVLEPARKGIIRGVHVADFASLYPSIIITWNMSPETRVDEPVRISLRPHYLPRLPDEPNERKAGECEAGIVSTRFKCEPPGILPIAIAELLKLRRAWNERKAAATPGTPEWKAADRRSTAYKIAANSFYGIISSPVSRFFDRSVGEAVTQTGAWLIKETIKAAAARGMEALYGDTDSVFVAGCTRQEFAEFVAWCNAELYPKLLPVKGCQQNHIKLAYEKAFDRLVMCAAKRYAGSYSHYKGSEATAESKPEIKGLEFKRGDSVRLARQMQEEIVYSLLGYKCEPSEDPATFEAIADRYRVRVLEGPLTLPEVVIAKSLSKDLKEYTTKIKKDGTEGAGAAHVQIAKMLKTRGQDVGMGTKIRMVCMDGSCSPKRYVPADDWTGECDRFDLWESLVWPPTRRVLEVVFPGHDWSRWDRVRPAKLRAARGRKKVTEQKTEGLPWGERPAATVRPH